MIPRKEYHSVTELSAENALTGADQLTLPWHERFSPSIGE